MDAETDPSVALANVRPLMERDVASALARLNALSTAFENDIPLRRALAESVGRLIIKEQQPALRKNGRQVVNVLPFNGETMLLRIRLAEMAWVDHFVIVEARHTFTGVSKPLYFEQVRHEFAASARKISYLVIDEFPPQISTAWARDYYQRDFAAGFIAGLCDPDDIVLITDADEIANVSALEFPGEFAHLKMETCRFFLNHYMEGGPRHTGAVCRAGLLLDNGLSHIRFTLSRIAGAPGVPNAGWHFTSVGDAGWIAHKFKGYAHQEKKKRAMHDEGHVGTLLDNIRAGKIQPGWTRRPIDETFPAFIRENQAELAQAIL